MKANNFEILNDSGNDAIWRKILASYKEVSKKDPTLKFSGKDINDEEKLKKQCAETLKRKTNEDGNSNNYYEKTKRWCTVPTSVQKVLEKGWTILSTDTTPSKDTENQTEWDEKIKKYTAQTNKDKITGLDLGQTPIKDITKDHRDKIKTECKKLNEKQSFEEGYGEAINKSKTWCSIEKKPNQNNGD